MQKRHPLSFPVFLLLAVLAIPASAAEFFVSPQGDDSNDGGSASAPWRTIAKANKTVRPGDTVHLLGGKYVDDPIRPAKSGTAEAPIRYAALANEEPVLTSNSKQGLEVAIDLSKRSHIVVEGIHVDGVRRNPSARVKHFVKILDGSYNTVRNCDFRFAHGWYGIRLDKGAHNNRLTGNTIDVVGRYDDGNGNDWGDSVQILDAEHNLFEGNTVRRGAHNLLQVKGRYNVIRGNTFENDWSDILGSGKGGRNLSLMGKYNLFDGNIVRNAGKSADKPSNAGQKVEGEGNIVRRNLIYANSNEGITSQSRRGSKIARENHIFHNTIYANGGPAWSLIYYKGGNGVRQNVFKNNIVYANRSDSRNGDADLVFNLKGDPGGVVGGSLIASNLIVKQSSGDANVEIDDGGGLISLENAEKRYPENFSNNIQDNPAFVSSQPQKPSDFELAASSRGVDEAAPLTRTKGSGSGTKVRLEDAGYFSDGFSVALGDRIRIGGGAPVRIVETDYSAGTVTLDASTSWEDGAPVSLEFEGDAPDIGAREAGSASRRPQPPGTLSGTRR